MAANQNPETIKMLDNALMILDALRVGSKKLGVNEIAKQCGINLSTAFRILKTLEVNGVGYRAQKQGKQLVMNLGYSHQVVVDEIPGITIDVPAPNKVVIHGPDKQKVGQFAAEVREKRPPEPYKGKGIKYDYEVIRRKEGKAGKKA